MPDVGYTQGLNMIVRMLLEVFDGDEESAFHALCGLGHGVGDMWKDGLLTPVQAVVATITSDADDYAEEVAAACRAAGLRVESDTRNEKINYKVREHSLAKVPVLLVAGKKEAAEGTVSIRRLGSNDQTVLPLDEALALLAGEAMPPDLRRKAA